MATKTEIEKRRNALLSALEAEPNGLSYSELETILGKKKRTIASDVEELRKTGSEIIIKKDVLQLVSRGNVISHSNRQIVRRLRILNLLDMSGKSMTRKDIKKQIDKLYNSNALYGLNEIENHEDTVSSEVVAYERDKTLEIDLNELVNAGWLLKQSDKYELGWNAPKTLTMKENHPNVIFNLINDYGNDLVYRDVLFHIKKQFEMAMQYKLFYDKPNQQSVNYIIGKKNSFIIHSDDIISAFNNSGFKNNLIKVEYQISEDNIVERIIGTGLLVYSIDHGKLYLFGKEYTINKTTNVILNVQKIKNIDKLPEINSVYMSEEFLKIYDEMFSISVEEPYDVEVIFDDIFNIREKLERLKSSRPTSNLISSSGKLIYTDTIRGINDFAKYLRGFGMSCIVIKPDILVKKMYDSAKKTYSLYQNDNSTIGDDLDE